MVVIRLQGGLGNQLFQYALALHLESETNQDVFFESSVLDARNCNFTSREFALHYFKCSIPIIDSAKADRFGLNYTHLFFRKVFNRVKSLVHGVSLVKEENFSVADFAKARSSVFFVNGYFQSESYFGASDALIRSRLCFDRGSLSLDDSIIDVIKSKNAVSIHFRRGDYVLNSDAAQVHGTCDMHYYNRALAYIKSKVINPYFVVCSDDINWVKENFDFGGNCYWSEGSMIDDLYLMSICKHNIIANSSFSWWGAWLNSYDDKIVLAPQRWFLNDSMNEQHDKLIPDKWIKI